jgi:hypothetical protein
MYDHKGFLERWLGTYAPDSKFVRVRSPYHAAFSLFQGPSIPFNQSTYILYGYTLLPNGTQVPTQFTIDTRKPSLLVGVPYWQIDGKWHFGFVPDSLKLLGLTLEEATPFHWTSNVPIETIENPPYLAGQPLHGRPPHPSVVPQPPPESGETVGGASLVSLPLWVSEPKEKVWSCGAKRPGAVAQGELFFTFVRVLFCPHLSDYDEGEKPFVPLIGTVVDIGAKSVPDPHSAGGKRMGLRLIIIDGSEETFLVDSLVKAMDEFSKRRRIR